MAYKFSEEQSLPGTYHVWGKALDGVWLFRDDEDRANFEAILANYLTPKERRSRSDRPTILHSEEVSLCAANFLSSHYHLILWQRIAGGIERLMRRVIQVYTRYYHHKYGTRGSLFPGPFRARLIVGEKSLKWRIGYVQKNHKRLGLKWEFSTHRYFITDDFPAWLEVRKTLDVFGGRSQYLRYMEKYELRAALDEELRIDDPFNPADSLSGLRFARRPDRD